MRKKPKDPRGRKKQPPELVASKKVGVRFTPPELEAIQAAADREAREIGRPYPVTRFVRDAAVEWARREIEEPEND